MLFERAQTDMYQETELLLERTSIVPLEPYDIISDPKTVGSLSLLYNSMVSSKRNTHTPSLCRVN